MRIVVFHEGRGGCTVCVALKIMGFSVGMPWELNDANTPRIKRSLFSLCYFDCLRLENQFVLDISVACTAKCISTLREQSRPDNRCVVFPRMVPIFFHLGRVLFFATTCILH